MQGPRALSSPETSEPLSVMLQVAQDTRDRPPVNIIPLKRGEPAGPSNGCVFRGVFFTDAFSIIHIYLSVFTALLTP
jgi:hypothetical protein